MRYERSGNCLLGTAPCPALRGESDPRYFIVTPQGCPPITSTLQGRARRGRNQRAHGHTHTARKRWTRGCGPGLVPERALVI